MRSGTISLLLLALGIGSGLVSCTKEKAATKDRGKAASDPRIDEATVFVTGANKELRALWVDSETRSWEQATNITDETQKAAAAAHEKVMAYLGEAIPAAAKLDDVEVDADTRRQLELLKRATNLPAPSDPARRKELAALSTEMEGMYAKGRHCADKGGTKVCRDLGELSDVLARSRSTDDLLDAWVGWRTISPPMRAKYRRLVELGNEGAKQIGYADVGELWRSKYDMDPAELEQETDRLWDQVKPLYEQLHCYARDRLAKKYGKELVDPEGPIPAHLLGNMWAQEWANIYPLMEPYAGQPSIDVTRALRDKGYDSIKMVKQAEAFFVSLGLDPLPKTFWERSMFERPADRDVVCHASAWDPGFSDDMRIKMCIKIDMEDFVTIHHELGHTYYFHYYHQLPVLYHGGAHDGFHEAIGDTLSLSVTPAYLGEIGLLDEVSDDEKAIVNKQMQDALDKIAFLPFGLLIDKWRWGVFSGKIDPASYNAAWWELRLGYQGIEPPVERSEEDFDPGAKYHIPANTPYSRYFLARILQFQFHEALCAAAGHEGPLHTCSIHGSKEAGKKLQAVLELGMSKPWPDALEKIAGTRKMDATPLIEYFAPLSSWLEKENGGRTCGWTP
jgi:peptidyl-dipeptidase A